MEGQNTVLADVPVSIWATGQSSTNVGEAVDFDGIAPQRFKDELQAPNRQLLIDGDRYRIIQAHGGLMSPYVELRLRRMGGRS